MSEDGVMKTLVGLQKSVAQVCDELPHHKDSTDPEDKFYSIMSEFGAHAQSRLEIVEVRFDKMKEMIVDTAEFFCVDLKKQPIEEMFTDINTFMDNFEVCSLFYPCEAPAVRLVDGSPLYFPTTFPSCSLVVFLVSQC